MEKEFVRLRPHTDTQMHTKTHARRDWYLGFRAAGVLYTGRWCTVIHLHENIELRQQKDAFKTADLEHFASVCGTIIPNFVCLVRIIGFLNML